MFDSKVVRDYRIILKTLGFTEASTNAEDIYRQNQAAITAKIAKYHKVTEANGQAAALKDFMAA